ncbi:hypothetical protein ACS0TY_004143 [Phlomoides rotata]
MNLRIFSGRTVNGISKLNSRVIPGYSAGYRCVAASSITAPSSFHPLGGLSFVNCAKDSRFDKSLSRYVHTLEHASKVDSLSALERTSETDATMNEFLSRFVWVMRKKLFEAYPDCDKNTIKGMLTIIVENVVSEIEKGGLQQMTGAVSSMPSGDLSEDLWRTVWEVSHLVMQDMEKEKKKERMKSFLQSEEVKQMYRFAGQVGIRGELLRELRFKWAREKMEQSDFYESLERLHKESGESDELGKENAGGKETEGDYNNVVSVSLPKRHGEIKYKIYGLDLSGQKWEKVVDKIHETGEVMWPQEAKPISGKCKIVTEKILSLQEDDDPAPLLREWIDLLEPSRIDWVALLDKLKDHNSHLYYKIAESVLCEESFKASIHDYSKLVDGLAKENRLEDVERILKKMSENGILPDVILSALLIQIYCKSGNLDRAKESFDSLRAQGFMPDMKAYNSMVVAYVNAGRPKEAEALFKDMEAKDIKVTKETYMALLRALAKAGMVDGADRIFTSTLFYSSHNLESWTIMIEAYARVGNHDRARNCFNQMMKLGHKPDDACIASVIAAYEKKNLFDEALNLLLELEKNGFELGVSTYTILVDWFTKLELFDEAEQILEKVSEQGEAPPFKLHISLCDMYIKSGAEKKALQALGVLESKIEQLEAGDFERIIVSLKEGGFQQDAQRLRGLMEARGFVLSERVKVSLTASQAMGHSNKRKLSLLGSRK